MHIESLAVEDVAQPEQLRRRLIRYLRPAITDSRELTRVHSAEMADGALHGEVSVFGESVELSLYIIDKQRKEEVAAVNVEMSKADVVGSGVAARLAECAVHIGADRVPEAAQCYREVRKLDPGNAPAQAGLARVEERYVENAKGAIRRGALAEARGHVERLGELSPEHPRVSELEGEIAGAERKAKERRIAKLTPEMVRIEKRCFEMGSPESEMGRAGGERRHRVCVEAFSMGKHEVTFAEYDRFVEATGRSRPDDSGWGRERRPVINVSLQDATAYARWLSGETGRRYRVPTEAEWEYAARAGTETAYPWGNSVGRGRANCNGCGSRWDGQTSPAGSFEANAWGLHDTVGNVFEWTCSEYDGGYGGAEQRCASGSAGDRVIRGGSWKFGPGFARSAYRLTTSTDFRIHTLGFRLAQD